MSPGKTTAVQNADFAGYAVNGLTQPTKTALGHIRRSLINEKMHIFKVCKRVLVHELFSRGVKNANFRENTTKMPIPKMAPEAP